MANLRTFSDLDFSFTPHPDTGDVLKTYDTNAIKAAIKHLVLTGFYERPYHPEIGSGLTQSLFEHWNSATKEVVERVISQLIDNFEPRASVQNVVAEWSDVDNSVRVEVTLFLNALMQEVSIDFLLDRIR